MTNSRTGRMTQKLLWHWFYCRINSFVTCTRFVRNKAYRPNERTCEWTKARTNEQRANDQRTDGNGRTDGRTDGQTNERTNERANERKEEWLRVRCKEGGKGQVGKWVMELIYKTSGKLSSWKRRKIPRWCHQLSINKYIVIVLPVSHLFFSAFLKAPPFN